MPVPLAIGEPGSRKKGKKNSIMMGGKDDKMCPVKATIKKKGRALKEGKK